MQTKINPFRPGQPVPPNIFSGRENELNQIYRCLAQTTQGSPQNLLIIGERGVGKTSIGHFSRCMAQNDKGFPGTMNSTKKPFIAPFVAVQKDTPATTVVKQILDEITWELSPGPKAPAPR